jgi:phosphoribosylformylglycinamidine synthase
VRVSSIDDTDASPRFVAARFSAHGDRPAVLESVRAVACAGAMPIAIATAVAFGERADAPALIALLERVVAVTEAAAELGVAVIWIQSENGDQSVVTFGLTRQAERLTPPFPGGAGERLVFLGETATEIAGSRFLPAVHGSPAGAVLATDYARERKLHEVLQTLTRARVITAAHSVSAGGLLVAVCGMLLAGETPMGARLDVTSLGGTRADALLFGETQGRAIVAVAADRVGTVLSEAHMHGVPAALIGEVVAEPLLELKTRSLATEWRVAELQAAWG